MQNQEKQAEAAEQRKRQQERLAQTKANNDMLAEAKRTVTNRIWPSYLSFISPQEYLQKLGLSDDRRKLFDLEREHRNKEAQAQAEEKARAIQQVIVLLCLVATGVLTRVLGRE